MDITKASDAVYDTNTKTIFLGIVAAIEKKQFMFIVINEEKEIFKRFKFYEETIKYDADLALAQEKVIIELNSDLFIYDIQNSIFTEFKVSTGGNLHAIGFDPITER